MNSVEGALRAGKKKRGWIPSKPLLHLGIDFQPFAQQGSVHPVKCLSESSGLSSDQHLPDAGAGLLSSCVQPGGLLASEEGESSARNLSLFIDFCYLRPGALQV